MPSSAAPIAFLLSFFGGGLANIFSRFARERKERNIFLGLFSSVILGIVFGVLLLLVVPILVVRNVTVPGISLILTPLLVGGTMQSV